MDTRIYNLQIRVLVYQEGGQFVAHALEMDLLGYGRTEKSAVKELCSLIDSQLSFARFKNDDSLLAFPAAKEYFERWETAHAAALKKMVLEDQPGALSFKAICISPDDKVSRLPKRRFEPVELSCA